VLVICAWVAGGTGRAWARVRFGEKTQQWWWGPRQPGGTAKSQFDQAPLRSSKPAVDHRGFLISVNYFFQRPYWPAWSLKCTVLLGCSPSVSSPNDSKRVESSLQPDMQATPSSAERTVISEEALEFGSEYVFVPEASAEEELEQIFQGTRAEGFARFERG